MMNFKNITGLFLFGVLALSCQQQSKSENTEAEKDLIFEKGATITNANFIGTAWLNNLMNADSINTNSVGSVTFEPGARTNWHSHPTGQIILAIGGEGYYQEKDSPKKILHKGDVVKCPPNVPHWHGASREKAFIQIAITSRQDGPTKWMYPVTEKEYLE
ncbi:MAG TPA: cupin domain-containing protein [Agriterribacter sp.]|nr:cupin domain-containing protein [Agriterribacter sp.]